MFDSALEGINNLDKSISKLVCTNDELGNVFLLDIAE